MLSGQNNGWSCHTNYATDLVEIQCIYHQCPPFCTFWTAYLRSMQCYVIDMTLDTLTICCRICAKSRAVYITNRMCHYYSSFIGNWAKEGEKERFLGLRPSVRARGKLRTAFLWAEIRSISENCSSHQTRLPGRESNRHQVGLAQRWPMNCKWSVLQCIPIIRSSRYVVNSLAVPTEVMYN